MKLTPLDIHHKEFRHSLRGYNEEEVDAFLDEVADEFERLFKENIDLSEKLDTAREQVRGYEAQKETLHNTMVAAQRSAEDIVTKAREEAGSLLKDAEVKAKEIIHNALTQKQKVAGELVRIKQAEEDFRARFKKMLEDHVKSVAEIDLPKDVTVLMGETEEGMVADVEVAAQQARDAVQSQPVTAPADMGTKVPAPQPAQPGGRQSVAASQGATEPPASGFVQGVSLGEVDGPDLAAEVPDFGRPKEFDLTQLDAFGEREDDMDIEEID